MEGYMSIMYDVRCLPCRIATTVSHLFCQEAAPRNTQEGYMVHARIVWYLSRSMSSLRFVGGFPKCKLHTYGTAEVHGGGTRIRHVAHETGRSGIPCSFENLLRITTCAFLLHIGRKLNVLNTWLAVESSTRCKLYS